MNNIKEFIQKIMDENSMIDAVLSNLRKKDPEKFHKVTVRPILLKEEVSYQWTYHYEKKVTHENTKNEEAVERFMELFHQFKQGQIFTKDADFQVLISKKFKTNILRKPPSKKEEEFTHNRKKNYIIPENIPCSFLKRLGVMNEKGKVLSQKYDKFRQINRFLEMVGDVMPYLKKDREMTIIDFGCGKSYLTFALYHYLKNIQKLSVKIIGLDLKKDVVNYCNEVAKDLEYDDLKFMVGDIEHFTGADKVDMVVTLHACDTATDAALVKAIEWDADVILSVPCCQHELFDQIHHEVMIPMEKHGIIKERLSSLITDSMRANILEIMGYSTKIIEFISLEHTAKNLLIRAVKTNKTNQKTVEEYQAFKKFWNIHPYFEKALGKKFIEKVKNLD